MHVLRMTDHVGLLRLERVWHGKVGTKTVRTCIPYSLPDLEVEAGKKSRSASLDSRSRCPGRYREQANQAFFPGTLFSPGQKRELVHAERRKQAAVAEARLQCVHEEGWSLRWPGPDSATVIERIKLQLAIPLNLCDLHLDLSSDWRGWFVSCLIRSGRQHFLDVSVHRKRLGLPIC
jgi:hypothetical protein